MTERSTNSDPTVSLFSLWLSLKVYLFEVRSLWLIILEDKYGYLGGTMLFLEYEMLWISLYARCAVVLVLALLYTTFIYGSIVVLIFLELHLLKTIICLISKLQNQECYQNVS